MKLKIAVFALSVVWASQATASSFDALYVFGDSTVDSGWWGGALNGQCGTVTASCTTGSIGKDALISQAIANGGTGAPVGVGLMNTQILATDLGISNFLPANQPNGTNYAISGALSNVTAGLGNLNPNPNLPSTVQQVSNYLGPALNMADPNALYLISSGGNDITYAKDNITNPNPATQVAARELYLAGQAQALANQIATLQSDGAKHIVVYGNAGSGTLGIYWTGQLFTDLTNLSVNFIGADIAAMVTEVQANPTAYGFTSLTDVPGIVGAGTGSACATQTNPGSTNSGWGQWCANKETTSSLYASLTSSNAEQTSFYSDNQHFSAAGQLIEANYVFGLIQSSEAPLPATLPLFASGLGALGMLGWRRKRKNAVTLAA